MVKLSVPNISTDVSRVEHAALMSSSPGLKNEKASIVNMSMQYSSVTVTVYLM